MRSDAMATKKSRDGLRLFSLISYPFYLGFRHPCFTASATCLHRLNAVLLRNVRLPLGDFTRNLPPLSLLILYGIRTSTFQELIE